MTGKEIVDLTKKHTLYECRRNRRSTRSLWRAPRHLFLDSGREAVYRLQQPVDVCQHWTRRRACHPGHRRAGCDASLSNPFMATEPRARLGAKLAEIAPGILTRSFLRMVAPRRTKMPSSWRAFLPDATRSWRAIARITALRRVRSAYGDPRRWTVEPGMPGVVRVLDPYHGIERGWNRRKVRCHDRRDIQLEGSHTIAGSFWRR